MEPLPQDRKLARKNLTLAGKAISGRAIAQVTGGAEIACWRFPGRAPVSVSTQLFTSGILEIRMFLGC
jgi:hypothetical protein